MDYAELHCHSGFSLLDGAATPEALVERAVALGLRALALTDHDDLGGIARFAQAAREHGDFPAIPGLELTLRGGRHLTLLARTGEGYANLSRLVTRARADLPRGRPQIDLDTLQAHRAGLLCLSGCPRGPVAARLRAGDRLGARREAGRLRDLFGEHFALEVMDHALPEEARLNVGLVALARELGSPWVVTNNAHYARPADRVLHDVLTCLRHHTTLDEAGRRLRPNAEWHLKGPAAMAERWAHAPEGLRTSVELAERCTFRLAQLDPKLPALKLRDGFTDPDAYLAHLAEEGAAKRWGDGVTPQHRAQLEHELDLIGRRGLAGYFLIMKDIVDFAESQRILVQGRGSSANSAVCYCLGITAVDPIRHELLFERFLSEERDGYPDIDLDIEHARREVIIQWVYREYGREHAAMVCENICFRGRSAVRDAARALGFSVDEGARLAEQVHGDDVLEEADVRGAGFDPGEGRMRALLHVARGLQDLPRHRSIHVGGFVLSAQPIAELVPIEPAAMEARTIIQWDKDDLDALKLPKFDLLGLGMLTALREGLDLVNARHRLGVGLYNLPDDPVTYDMIGRADTVGVFQIESRAQMNTLPRTRPRTFYELAIQVALIRPGPLQGDMVHPYIRRKRGEEAVEPLHPALASILDRTLGVPLFQEQGMRLAVAAAGFTTAEADALRRAMGSKRHRFKLETLAGRLREGMRARGIPAETAERIIRQIQAFSTYGFPESHSMSFALLVYASAWLRCRYPAEFLCALLNAQPMGFYSPASLVQDARRHGVEVRPPCMARSDWPSRMEGDAVRLGLRLVEGLGAEARATLEQARAGGPFGSIDDVVRRTRLGEAALRTLAGAGAFDAFVPEGRREALWGVLRAVRARGDTLPFAPPDEPAVVFRPLDAVETLAADYRTTGLTTGVHPMTHLRPWLAKQRVLRAADLEHVPHDRPVRVAGLVTTRQRPEAAKGFFFVTLEDETGFTNIIVPPRTYERHRRVLVQAHVLLIQGRTSREQDVCNVKGQRFEELDFSAAGPLPPARSFR